MFSDRLIVILYNPYMPIPRRILFVFTIHLRVWRRWCLAVLIIPIEKTVTCKILRRILIRVLGVVSFTFKKKKYIINALSLIWRFLRIFHLKKYLTTLLKMLWQRQQKPRPKFTDPKAQILFKAPFQSAGNVENRHVLIVWLVFEIISNC